MKTVLETLQGGAGYLENRGIESGRLQMEHLLAHVLKYERLQLYLEFDRPLEEGELAPLRELVKRRGEGEPLQHLLGMVEFYGREFICDARALIPRPETEELVEKILKRFPENTGRLLDMGVGSGVIGLTLASERPNCQVTLLDRSGEALSLARENATRLEIPEERAEFAESDLFEKASGTFAVIVANLPYVPEGDAESLSKEVKRDPRMALFGGVSGTEIIERFVGEATAFLEDEGLLALEVGIGQAGGLSELIESAGFKEVEIEKDCSGIDRFLFARKVSS